MLKNVQLVPHTKQTTHEGVHKNSTLYNQKNPPRYEVIIKNMNSITRIQPSLPLRATSPTQ